MNGLRCVLGAAVFALMAQAPVFAAAPARNANVWDGTAHEPNPTIVHTQEKAAGVQLSPQQQTEQTDTVEHLAQQLCGSRQGILVGCRCLIGC